MTPVVVREDELDLDAFEAPSTCCSRSSSGRTDLAELDLAGVVIAFVDQLAERDELDLDVCGEFLVLISALLELKARGSSPTRTPSCRSSSPSRRPRSLARRLAEYRRAKEGAAWLTERLAEDRDRFFRLGPAPLAPARPEPTFASQEPEKLAAVLRLLAQLSRPSRRPRTWRCASRRSRSSSSAGARYCGGGRGSTSTRGGRGLSRVEVAVAFLALLELSKQGELALAQAAPFAPIRISRPDVERRIVERPLRLIPASPVEELARTIEALLVVASQPLPVEDLAVATADDRRAGRAGARVVGDRYFEGRSGIVLEHVAGGWAFRASRDAAAACARLFERPVERGSRRRRSRRSRSSRTSARARGPR